MSQRLRSVPGRTKTKAFAVIARNAGEADTVRFHFRPCLRTHEPPQRRDHIVAEVKRTDYDVQVAKRDLGKILDRIEAVNKPKAA